MIWSFFFSIFLFFISLNAIGCDFHDFDSYQKKLTAAEIEWKIKTFLEKNSEIQRYYRLTSEALYIGDLENQQIDYVLYLNKKSLIFPNKRRIKENLKNIKIAIDPGHFGGALAELEERYIAIPAEQTNNNQPIRFHEGDLTYLTALELQRLLQRQGAQILLTRSGIGQGAIGEDFFKWLKKHDDLIPNNSLSKIFRNYYNAEDLKERAKKINEFSPDITIIIHYNAHLSKEEKNQNTLVTKSNFSLAFVPGAFCAGELGSANDRYEFLRLIVTDQVQESVKLSTYITDQFVKQLGVPLITLDEKTSYKDTVCLMQKPGVYCRNLALTRLVHSPLCYGETLIQNNEDEMYRLSTNHAFIENTPCPERVKVVAQAYFEGIKAYVNRRGI